MKTPKKYSWHFRKRNFLIFLLYFRKQLSKLKKWKTPTFKNFLFFLQKSFSYISRVVKTNFLILLVLKDKNSCFLPRRTPQGFSFFNFFRCFIFHLSRVFSVFIFLGCFHFPPFSGVFIFHLSQVFHFSPFSGVFAFLYCACYGFERALFLPWWLQGLSLRFETQTRSICLFESHSVQQKVSVGRFYLYVKVQRNTISTSYRFWTH